MNFTLSAKLSGAVYCYRSCLCVCNGRAACVCECVGVCVGLLPR